MTARARIARARTQVCTARGTVRATRGTCLRARKNGRVEETADEVLTRLHRYVSEESPEEVLARLERYVASLRAPVARADPAAPVDQAAPAILVDTRAAAQPVPAVDTFIPSRTEPAPRPRPRFISEVAPALLAVSICAFMILVFELFDPVVAVVVGVAFALVGVIGLVQRVPLAKAWIVGLVVAGLLIRFS
jgi:hypothetical protein